MHITLPAPSRHIEDCPALTIGKADGRRRSPRVEDTPLGFVGCTCPTPPPAAPIVGYVVAAHAREPGAVVPERTVPKRKFYDWTTGRDIAPLDVYTDAQGHSAWPTESAAWTAAREANGRPWAAMLDKHGATQEVLDFADWLPFALTFNGVPADVQPEPIAALEAELATLRAEVASLVTKPAPEVTATIDVVHDGKVGPEVAEVLAAEAARAAHPAGRARA